MSELTKINYKVVNILPEYISKIKDGSKKLEFRSWHSKVPYFMLKNEETGKIELVIEILDVMDLNVMDPEDKEDILDQQGVSEEFREKYDCRYAYMIGEVNNVH